MPLDNLLSLWEQLSDRERKVFLTYGYRLLAGQKKYGPLNFGKKDWVYEAIEEALDTSVYLTALLQDRVDYAYDKAIVDAEKEIESSGWLASNAEARKPWEYAAEASPAGS